MVAIANVSVVSLLSCLVSVYVLDESKAVAGASVVLASAMASTALSAALAAEVKLFQASTAVWWTPVDCMNVTHSRGALGQHLTPFRPADMYSFMYFNVAFHHLSRARTNSRQPPTIFDRLALLLLHCIALLCKVPVN
jgi:hypothetical protein